MGLFSSNRISSIAIDENENNPSTTQNNEPVELDTEKDENGKEITEASEKVEDDVEDVNVEIDPDVEAMLGDDDYDFKESYFDNVEINDSFNGILETCINIDQNDKNVFESMISLDFVSICKENTIGVDEGFEANNSAKKDKLHENVNKLFIGMSSSIDQLGAITNMKASKLLESDGKLYTKYAKVLKEENLDGFVNEANLAFPSVDSSNAVDRVANLESLHKIFSESVQGIAEAESKEDVDEIMSLVREYMDIESDKFINDISESLKVNEDWTPSSVDIDFMVNYANENFICKALEVSTLESVESLNTMRDEASDAIDACSESTHELNTYKVNKIYNLSSAATKIAGKKYQAYIDLMVHEMANIRKAYLVCGSYASKKATGKDTSIEEVVLNAVCESSDTYVFDRFE